MHDAPPGHTSTYASTATHVHGGLHILIIDPLFRPPNVPGETRTYDLARRFRDAGHLITVVTTTAAHGGASDNVTPWRRRYHRHTEPHAGALRLRRRSQKPVGVRARIDMAHLARDRGGRGSELRPADKRAIPTVMLFALVRGIPLIQEVRQLPPPPLPGATLGGERLGAAFSRAAALVGNGLRAPNHRRLARGARYLGGAAHPAIAKIVVSACTGCDYRAAGRQERRHGGELPASRTRTAVGLCECTFRRHIPRVRSDRHLPAPCARQVPKRELRRLRRWAHCADASKRKLLENGVLDKTLVFLDPVSRNALALLLTRATAVIADGASQGFYDGLAAARPLVLLGQGWQQELIESRGAGITVTGDNASMPALVISRTFLKDTDDGLRRASQQASALAAGRFNLERVAAALGGVIDAAVAAEPRAAVMRRRRLRTKRAIDVVISLATLIVLSPVIAVLAIIVAVKLGWPVIFTQQRPGLKGRPFRIFKFRTMKVATDKSGAALPDAARLTPLGRFLRRFSLDELPELVNVLLGQMSLIGPRPLLPEYLPYYTPEQRRRHDLRPGITGWAQINGRNDLSWEERFMQDVWYVRTTSPSGST